MYNFFCFLLLQLYASVFGFLIFLGCLRVRHSGYPVYHQIWLELLWFVLFFFVGHFCAFHCDGFASFLLLYSNGNVLDIALCEFCVMFWLAMRTYGQFAFVFENWLKFTTNRVKLVHISFDQYAFVCVVKSWMKWCVMNCSECFCLCVHVRMGFKMWAISDNKIYTFLLGLLCLS